MFIRNKEISVFLVFKSSLNDLQKEETLRIVIFLRKFFIPIITVFPVLRAPLMS